MLGQLCWDEALGQKIILNGGEVESLRTVQGILSPKETLLSWRLGRLAKKFRRHGVSRLLVPNGFSHWDILEKYGLSSVQTLPFLRVLAGPLLLTALVKGGYDPKRCTIALRGRRVTKEMERAVDYLLPHVRDIVITAPSGGEDLIVWMRQEWGIASRPDRGQMEGVVCFDGTVAQNGVQVLTLFEDNICICGLGIKLTEKESSEGTEQLPLLAALWETGRIELSGLEFYLT